MVNFVYILIEAAILLPLDNRYGSIESIHISDLNITPIEIIAVVSPQGCATVKMFRFHRGVGIPDESDRGSGGIPTGNPL